MTTSVRSAATPARVRGSLDALLGRLTTYRWVLLSLLVITAAALVAGATGGIAFGVPAQLASLAVLGAVTAVATIGFAAAFRVRAHPGSAPITALLLFCILQPSTDPAVLSQLALAALVATASKFLLVWRGRHLLNPAAVGATWLSLVGFPISLWWVGTPVLVPVVAVTALLVLLRTREWPTGLVFVVLAVAAVALGPAGSGSWAETLRYALTQTPVLFLAGFMLTEPLTLPPRRWQRWIVAAVVAVPIGIPVVLGPFAVGPEGALLLGNLVAFVLARRSGVALTLVGSRRLADGLHRFEFQPGRPVRHRAGQYLELTVPHRGADSRGSRRVFSLMPADGDRVAVAMRVPERSSSWKRALLTTEIGSTLQSTGVAGDFLLPRDADRPVALLAGGIGITPFAAHVREAGDRDLTVVLAVRDPAEAAPLAELVAGATRVVVIAPERPPGLPAHIEHLTGDRLDAVTLARAVPDLARRTTLVSGSPTFVASAASAARAAGARRVRRDAFSGY